MKTDNYLTLCLDQAAKSPLRYRHGCIIVRGGKVIGQGYNDYRPGFDGGALRNGRIAHSALDGPALADLKEKLKKRKQGAKQKNTQQHQPDPRQPQWQPPAERQFVAFEKMTGGSGGGPNVNAPLSMHSEMMAIHSALAASSTLASTTFSREKPCFKLPHSDKRKERLRKDALKAYVEAICDASGASNSTGKPGTGKLRAESNNNNAFHLGLDRAHEADHDHAFHEVSGGEKHHNQNQNQKKNGKKNQYEYQCDRHGRQIQPDSSQQGRRQSASKGTGESNAVRDHDMRLNEKHETTSRNPSASRSPGQVKKAARRAGKSKTPEPAPQQQHMLVPTRETSKPRNETQKRKKDARLVGADLYVTRLGMNKCQDTGHETPRASIQLPIRPLVASATEEDVSPSPSMTSSTSSLPSKTGSLHDELVNPNPRERAPAPPPSDFVRKSIHASRPCYRCISYMHAVGIKRVFWTNDAGDWEGGKVAQLVEAIEGNLEEGACGVSGGGVTGNGIFVTKHEVLMLKRTMGEG